MSVQVFITAARRGARSSSVTRRAVGDTIRLARSQRSNFPSCLTNLHYTQSASATAVTHAAQWRRFCGVHLLTASASASALIRHSTAASSSNARRRPGSPDHVASTRERPYAQVASTSTASRLQLSCHGRQGLWYEPAPHMRRNDQGHASEMRVFRITAMAMAMAMRQQAPRSRLAMLGISSYSGALSAPTNHGTLISRYGARSRGSWRSYIGDEGAASAGSTTSSPAVTYCEAHYPTSPRRARAANLSPPD